MSMVLNPTVTPPSERVFGGMSLLAPGSPQVVIALNLVLVFALQGDPDVISNTVRIGYGLLVLATLISCALASLSTALPLVLTLLIYAPITDAVTHLPVYGLRGAELLSAGLLAARYGRGSLAALIIAGFGLLHVGRFIAYQDSREHLYWAMQAIAGAFLAMVHRGSRAEAFPPNRLMWTACGATTGVLVLCLLAAARAGENLVNFVLNIQRLGLLDGASCNSLAFVCGAGLLWTLTVRGRIEAWMVWAVGLLVLGGGCFMTKTLGIMAVTFVVYFALVLLAAPGWQLKTAMIVLGLALAFAAWRPELIDDVFNLEEKDFATLSSRTLVWERCLDIIRLNPLLGVDFGEYEDGGLSAAYLLRNGDLHVSVLTPHNSLLAAFTFGGWVGGLAFAAFHVLVLVGARHGLTRLSSPARAVFGLGLFAMLAHMFTDVWFTYYYFLAALPLSLPRWGYRRSSLDTTPGLIDS